MIALYLPGHTWLHEIPATVKLLSLVFLSIALFPVKDGAVLASGVVLVFAIVLSLGRDAVIALGRLRAIIPIIIAILVFHAFLGTFGTGIVAVLRLSILLVSAYLITLTTRMDDMIDALSPVLKPLSVFGLSEQRLAMAIALVLRFTPVLAALGSQLSAAYRARSGRSGGFKLVAPLSLHALNAADHVAEAISARGGVDAHRDKQDPIERPQ